MNKSTSTTQNQSQTSDKKLPLAEVTWRDAALPRVPTDSASSGDLQSFPARGPLGPKKIAGVPLLPRLWQSASDQESLAVRVGEEVVGILSGKVISPMVLGRVSHNPFSVQLNIGQSTAWICSDCLLVDIEGDLRLAVPRDQESVVRALSLRDRSRLDALKMRIETQVRGIVASTLSEDLLNGNTTVGDRIALGLSEELAKSGVRLDALRLKIKPTEKLYYKPDGNVFHRQGLEVLARLERAGN